MHQKILIVGKQPNTLGHPKWYRICFSINSITSNNLKIAEKTQDFPVITLPEN